MVRYLIGREKEDVDKGTNHFHGRMIIQFIFLPCAVKLASKLENWNQKSYFFSNRDLEQTGTWSRQFLSNTVPLQLSLDPFFRSERIEIRTRRCQEGLSFAPSVCSTICTSFLGNYKHTDVRRRHTLKIKMNDSTVLRRLQPKLPLTLLLLPRVCRGVGDLWKWMNTQKDFSRLCLVFVHINSCLHFWFLH